MKREEGFVEVDGYRVWYARVGEGGVPLLVLHGGPGAGHDYLDPLEGLAADRTVVFYDQLGCGRSDRPDDTSLWKMGRFVDEVDVVRDALGLGEIHLLGQSWGGWLAIEYMLARPSGVVGLVLASTSASIRQFVAEAERLKAALPPDVYETMLRHEAAGELHHPDYEAAALEFYNRHVCRLDPWPEPMLRTIENLDGNPVYETMNGPNEFFVIGNLKDWDREDRLGEIRTPTLVTVGRHDEITPACAETLRRGIPGSEIRVFEESSHTAHLEETEEYLRTVGDFLVRVENG
ncbi:MAG TPA: proline iminopeptidase-family hydrolase [Rubrobacter sp.]|nr:proline iminopeptidase-family hydrolase [Rubrobacter sp.]